MQKSLAMLCGIGYDLCMTTTTYPQPTTTIPCRCGHFDRTIRHSCRLTRALVEFRATLLSEIIVAEDDGGLAAWEAEMAAPWCSICDGLGHTGEAHERGVDDGFDAWEAGRLGW